MEVKIACPSCAWEPDGGSYWECTCGHQWNTFDTAGKCPACHHVWRDTQCPGPHYPGGCGKWAPHEDWYQNLDGKMKAEVNGILKKKPTRSSI